MNKSIFALMIALCLISFNAKAHEGHDTPGALPPPPNGGKLAEAAHSVAHSGGAVEAEIFLEGKLEGSKLKIFAHALKDSSFETLKPSANLVMKELKIEAPRAKKTTSLVAKAASGFWEAEIGQQKERRLIVHISLLDGKETKTAKIQIER
jgi:hypothetical protein